MESGDLVMFSSGGVDSHYEPDWYLPLDRVCFEKIFPNKGSNFFEFSLEYSKQGYVFHGMSANGAIFKGK